MSETMVSDAQPFTGLAVWGWWLKRYPQFVLWVHGSGWLSWWVLQFISLVGAPSVWQVVAHLALATGMYIMAMVLDVVLGTRIGAWPRHCLWHYLLRLWVGVAIFPVACVLFLNKSSI